MADTVSVRTLISTKRQRVVRLIGLSDGTGESGIKKVDIATLLNEAGVKPDGLRIEQVRWCIQGFAAVTLSWDRTAAAIVAMRLCGSGYDDFRGLNKGVRDVSRTSGDVDTSEGNADGKGSILLSSSGPTNGGTYDITLWLGLAQNTVAT